MDEGSIDSSFSSGTQHILLVYFCHTELNFTFKSLSLSLSITQIMKDKQIWGLSAVTLLCCHWWIRLHLLLESILWLERRSAGQQGQGLKAQGTSFSGYDAILTKYHITSKVTRGSLYKQSWVTLKAYSSAAEVYCCLQLMLLHSGLISCLLFFTLRAFFVLFLKSHSPQEIHAVCLRKLVLSHSSAVLLPPAFPHTTLPLLGQLNAAGDAGKNRAAQLHTG